MHKRLIVLGFALAASSAGIANAQLCPAVKPACNDAAVLPNPIYVLTADTQQSMLKALGKRLKAAGAHRQMNVIYLNQSSCAIVDNTYRAVSIMSGDMDYMPVDPLWDEGTTCKCTVTAPTSVQLSSSAIFADSCGFMRPPTIGLFRGPLQGYLFAARESSTQRAITADEGYLLFGFGAAAAMVPPWSNPAQILIRPADASTLICTAAASGVPAGKAKGMSFTRSAELVTEMVKPANDNEQTLGILGCAPYDRERGKTPKLIRALAFKADQQLYAYYPDSTATSRDKRNMREGRYVPWSVTDWLAPVDANGNVPDANADYLLKLILDKPASPAPAFDPLESVIKAGLTPECAMKVTRSQELGDLSLYQSPTPCQCYFDSIATGAAPSSCITCTNDTPCGAGKCRHGYCEAR